MSKKSVYIHRNPKTNEAFYVGCGTDGQRPYGFSARSKEWKSYVKENGRPIVEIVKSGLTVKKGSKLEIETIKKFGLVKDGGTLVNTKIHSVGVRDMSKSSKMRLSKIQKGSTRTLEQKIKMSKGSKHNIPDDMIQPIIDEMDEMMLSGIGALKVEIILGKKYNVGCRTINRIRKRIGVRFIDYPETIVLVKEFRKFKAYRIGDAPEPKRGMKKRSQLVIDKRAKKSALTKEQIQYRADVRASFKKK